MSNKIVPTCEHLAMHGIKQSGEYEIDPDGELYGEDAIKVYCNFTTNTTEIRHNSETQVVLEKCSERGCFEHKIQFLSNSTFAQMKALADISESCSQEFTFDCFLTPLMYNNVSYGFWLDRYGIEQNFFAGEDYGNHTCQCGIEGNCVDEDVACNCDSKTPTWLKDSGLITEKELLPITAFKYGPMKYDIEEAKVQVGKLKCSGLRDPSFGYLHPQMAGGNPGSQV